jgi:hypothetical protein
MSVVVICQSNPYIQNEFGGVSKRGVNPSFLYIFPLSFEGEGD